MGGQVPQGGEGSLKQERMKQKKENEEPVSGNSLGELAPPTKHSTVEEINYNPDSEVDAENENEEPVSGNPLGELAPPKSTVGEGAYNLGSEVDAENRKVGSAPEKYLGELASPSH